MRSLKIVLFHQGAKKQLFINFFRLLQSIIAYFMFQCVTVEFNVIKNKSETKG